MKRCSILAHFVGGLAPDLAGRVMRCPTGTRGYQFHYHAPTAAYSPLAGRVPCRHRHQDINAALACTGRQK